MLPNIVPSALSMSSREIAELTDKRHDNVCRDVRKMFEELEISPLKFEESFTDGRGKERTEYLLPKRETVILTSGYSTIQRAKIVDRWLELEKGTDLSVLDPATQLLMQTVINQALIKAELEVNSGRLDKVEAILDSRAQYMTITAWGRVNNAPMSMKTAQALGAKCSAQCKKYDIRIGKVPCERWGEVNSYPVEVIDECVKKI